MKTYSNLTLAVSPRSTTSTSGSKTPARSDKQNSSYIAMLLAPMTVLACNVADRADITAVAILGYN
jgi:hypothetical protein